MSVSLIPFKMPPAMEIPAHLVERLERMPADAAVERGMELLLEIDAAAALIYERVVPGGVLELKSVVAGDEGQARKLKALLREEDFYGGPLGAAGDSLAGIALAKNSSLLIMGQARAGENAPLPPGLRSFLLDGSRSGDVGFIYVLTLAGSNENPLGALTLIRPPGSGPLNHEQPNLTEGLRQVLCRILDRAWQERS